MQKFKLATLNVLLYTRSGAKCTYDTLAFSWRIDNLRDSAIQSEEIIFILRMWQRRSLSEHNDSKSWRIDSKSWCHERQVRFSYNAKQARVLHRAHKRLSIYAMIVMPGQIEIFSQG